MKILRFLTLASICVALLCTTAQAQSQQCTFAWDEVKTNADGTPVTDLAGYRLYMSMQSGTQVAAGPNACDAPNCYQFMLTDLPAPANPRMTIDSCPDLSYWVATAFDTRGPLGTNESPFSNEVQVADRIAPPAPTGLRLELR